LEEGKIAHLTQSESEPIVTIMLDTR